MRTWTLFAYDRNERRVDYPFLRPTRDLDDVIAELERNPSACSRAERSDRRMPDSEAVERWLRQTRRRAKRTDARLSAAPCPRAWRREVRLSRVAGELEENLCRDTEQPLTRRD
jgi:hypothetical protein